MHHTNITIFEQTASMDFLRAAVEEEEL